MIETYNIKDFKGMKNTLGIGVHDAVGSIPKSPDSTKELINIPISSIKIPNGFKVTLFRNIYEDEDMSLFKKYELKIDDQYENFIKLDLSCCEGAKISVRVTETGDEEYTLSFRIFKNIIKNLEINRKEVKAKIFIFDSSIERDLTKPELDNRYILNNSYDLKCTGCCSM